LPLVGAAAIAVPVICSHSLSDRAGAGNADLSRFPL